MEFKNLQGQTKIVKLHDVLKRAIDKDPKIKDELLNLNINDEDETNMFCEKVFGDPKGMWKNTRGEQVKLLRRFYDDYHKESGSNFMRPDWSGDHGTFQDKYAIDDIIKGKWNPDK